VIVDAHCHVIPEAMTSARVPRPWRPQVSREDGEYRLVFRGQPVDSVTGEFTDVAAMLGEAAATGVSHLLLSPWINLVPVSAGIGEARLVCEILNDALAAVAASQPGRVSVLGAVPLQDPALAARLLPELAAAGLRGVEVPASVAGVYLGDDTFEPFWEAAEQAGTVVFVHPAAYGLRLSALAGYYLWNSVGNPLETAVTAAHLVAAGVLERHPGLAVLLAHGGGALPVVRGRLRRAFAVRPEAAARLADGPDASLRRLYYDTVTHDQDLLAGLIGYAGAGQVLLGSDRPFDMGSDDPVAEVRALGLDPGAQERVLGGNAARLLGVAGG
jgi:aminocarboxymuconate-semialdehyde decarboxylase